MIPRLTENIIVGALNEPRKIILLLGARQVGKTTLLKSILERFKKENKKTAYLNCDLAEDRRALDTTSITLLTRILPDSGFVFIDEVQRLENPGLTLKIIYDNLPSICVLATGSSSFDLKNKLSDTLTGRYFDFTLYPFCLREILDRPESADFLLPELLIFGSYPEVFLAKESGIKERLLEKITESYLFKDIFSFQRVRYPQIVENLARALAYQIGAEINENELANRLKIDRKTVINYLDVLEKAFVIFRLYPFSRNPRREIGKNYKVYFLDLGIRNALIGDFNPLEIRDDYGALWENFLILERIKKFANSGKTRQFYFWRSYGGAEIDLLEKGSRIPQMTAFEFKYRQGKISRGAISFSKKYSLPVNLINRSNYLDFI